MTALETKPHIPFAGGSYPVREGNLIRPLIDGEPAFRRICEAIEAARHSVWVTVAFIDSGFEMPDGRGSLFDVLDAAAARGLDVRALFWRNNEGSGFPEDSMFSGLPHHRAMLKARGARFRARWDRAQKAYCQHQKSWFLDAGQDGETAFVGGINLQTNSMSPPGHGDRLVRPVHDVYTEVCGPSATDVHHNFVQRWNEASERLAEDGSWRSTASDDLPFPTEVSPSRGDALAQVQRTVRAGHYTDGRPSPGGGEYPIAQGDLAIIEQYRLAIRAAKRSIYIENQAIGLPETVEDLHAALERGVEVVCVTPSEADGFTRAARRDPRSAEFFRRFGALDGHPNFTLAGIAAADADGQMRDIYVHSKVMLVDDAWGTIGSCNIGSRSFFGDIELNVSFWSPDTVKRLRYELFAEHLATDTSSLGDAQALRLFAEITRRNAMQRMSSKGDWLGMAFRLDAATYGV